jgi:hypothetical protein
MAVDFCLDQKNLVRGDLHVVSTTGGRAQTPKPVPEGCIAELRIGSDGRVIRGIAEMLPGQQTIHGWIQPFRFVALADDDYEGLKNMVSAGSA